MKRFRSQLTYANAMSSIAVFLVVAGGTAFAASEMLPKNSVGTKQLANEAVTPAKLSKASKASLTGPQGPKGDTGPTGASGSSGPKGDKGDKGDKGERGEPASTMWAVVNSNGTLRHGKGVEKVAGLPGSYVTINFEAPVTNCAIIASLGQESGGFQHGEVTADQYTQDGFAPTQVLVETSNSTGAAANLAFHVAVMC